jgi:hypothetical protein
MRTYWFVGMLLGLILLTPRMAQADMSDIRLTIGPRLCNPEMVGVQRYDRVEGPYYYEPERRIIYRETEPTIIYRRELQPSYRYRVYYLYDRDLEPGYRPVPGEWMVKEREPIEEHGQRDGWDD